MSDAIVLENVEKQYKLFSSRLGPLIELFGLEPILGRRYRLFPALNGVDLRIRRGERVGIIGRNGAGKTTLLKLLTQNFAPTKGKVTVNGTVQSLMDTGVGFHPEFTGMENIRASVIYNGLPDEAVEPAIQDILDFVELGDFLHQPVRTYSLGMLARLGFATATAVRPDILIVDEVLGAGDAYFLSKSAERMKRLTDGGVTLVLVSHSVQQILQFCDRAIWIRDGKVAMDGDALEVVKAYERFIRSIEETRLRKANSAPAASTAVEKPSGRSVSRWDGLGGLTIEGVRVLDRTGRETAVFADDGAVTFELTMKAERDGSFPCKYHFYVYTLDGRPLTLHLSEEDVFEAKAGETRTVRLVYDKLLLGNGDYVLSTAVYRKIDLASPNEAERYDLLDRSYQFRVDLPRRLDSSLFRHPSRWEREGRPAIRDVTSIVPKENLESPC